MSGKELFELLNDIDDGIVKEAGEELLLWRESQEGVVVRAGNSRGFPWLAVITSVACTAAAMFGVFVLLLRVGMINIIGSPENTDSTPSSSYSRPVQSGMTPELSDAVLYEKAAYAYERGDINELKRYEAGDKFGNDKVMSAKTTYKILDGIPVIQKQEIVLDRRLDFWELPFEKDESGEFFRLYLDIGIMEELGWPQFGEDFELQPIELFPATEHPRSISAIDVHFSTPIIITVDHIAKSVTLYSQNMNYEYKEMGPIPEE